MTLTEYRDVIQGTPEWDDLRRGIVTASTVGQLVTPKTIKAAANDHQRGLIASLAAERLTGWTDDTYVSDDMFRGHMDEPAAADAYAAHTGADVFECGFMVREFNGFQLGLSPDRLVGDDGLLEMKSRRPKKHVQTVNANEVPTENVAQCMAALLVSGREWLDYVSFCAGMKLWVHRVYPDQRWFDAIREAVELAEAGISELETLYRVRTKDMPMTERTVELDLVIGPKSAWT